MLLWIQLLDSGDCHDTILKVYLMDDVGLPFSCLSYISLIGPHCTSVFHCEELYSLFLLDTKWVFGTKL